MTPPRAKCSISEEAESRLSGMLRDLCCLPCDEAGDARSLLAREALSARSTPPCLPCAERKDLYRPTSTLAPVDVLHLTRAQFRTPRQRLMANEVLARQGLRFRFPWRPLGIVGADQPYRTISTRSCIMSSLARMRRSRNRVLQGWPLPSDEEMPAASHSPDAQSSSPRAPACK